MELPIWIDVFISPIRDSTPAKVACVAVLLLVLMDVVFGVLNACMNKEFSSEKMRQGIGHKCSELGFMLMGLIIDGTIVGGIDLGIGLKAPVLVTICTYIALMEIGSLLETFVKMNPSLEHSPLFRLLSDVKGKTNEKEEDDG